MNMNRKNIVLLFSPILVSLLFFSCSSNSLEGNWNTSALQVDGIYQEICISNINFTRKGKKLVAKGRSGVNLYNANVEIKGKALKISSMVNTGFNGDKAAMEFENLFFEAFVHGDSFMIKKDTLYIYNHEKKMELQLKKEKKE